MKKITRKMKMKVRKILIQKQEITKQTEEIIIHSFIHSLIQNETRLRKGLRKQNQEKTKQWDLLKEKGRKNDQKSKISITVGNLKTSQTYFRRKFCMEN